MKEMKTGKRLPFLVVAVLMVSLLIPSFGAGGAFVFADAGQGFDTKAFQVTAEVREDNSFLITEEIQTNFTQQKHGLYRDIQTSGQVYRQVDGETIVKPYRVKVSDIQVDGRTFQTENIGNGSEMFKRIQIGDADEYVFGEQTYVIRYKVTCYDDGIDAQDDFYWNMIPHGWKTSVESATLSIAMPKEFDVSQVEFLIGAYGAVHTDAVKWSVSGNTIIGELAGGMPAGYGVTANIKLPEGYFVGEKTSSGMLWLMAILIAAVPLVTLLLYLAFGRDKKVVETVEFYPPAGITSAEIGYIVDGTVDNKDIISLIIYWADRGYLAIEEREKKKFTLIRLSSLPEDAKVYEHTVFNGIFDSGSEVELSELKEFYNVMLTANEQLEALYKKTNQSRVFTKASFLARILSFGLMALPATFFLVFGTLAMFQPLTWAIALIPIMIALVAATGMFIIAYDKQDSMGRGKLATLWLFGGFLGISAALGIIVMGFTLGLVLGAVGAAAATGITIFLTVLMRQRTDTSSQLLGKILGFREFIRTAELDRLKLLAEETPEYFYRILPYAYVFGLSDVWSKHFEQIKVESPGWYHSPYYGGGFHTYAFMGAFHHCTRAMEGSMNFAAPSSGGGSGSFSSGGGFSGGGMGGGGGGSW